jgi:hypothetical protein
MLSTILEMLLPFSRSLIGHLKVLVNLVASTTDYVRRISDDPGDQTKRRAYLMIYSVFFTSPLDVSGEQRNCVLFM